MNVIRGFAEMVRQEGDDSVSSYGDRIVEHSDHLLELTDKQRKITEVLSNEPHLESIDTVAVIQRTVERLSNEYPNADIDLDLPSEATASATGGLWQAIEELVTNAITHSDQDAPDVEVHVTDDADTVRIRIADTGPGIPDTVGRKYVNLETSIERYIGGNRSARYDRGCENSVRQYEMDQRVVLGDHEIEPLYHGSGGALARLVDRPTVERKSVVRGKRAT